MAPRRRPPPRGLTADWPTAHSPDPAAEAVRLFVIALRDAVVELSLRQVSAITTVNHAALGKILSGDAWPDARTVALLESGLKVRLWPDLGASGVYSAARVNEVAGVDRADDISDAESGPGGH